MKSAKNYRLGIPAFTTKNGKSPDSAQRIYGHRKRPEIAMREESAGRAGSKESTRLRLIPLRTMLAEPE